MFGQDILREQAMLNIGLAIVLLIGYVISFLYDQNSSRIFQSSAAAVEEEEHGGRWSSKR
jgi:hypothetical protein